MQPDDCRDATGSSQQDPIATHLKHCHANYQSLIDGLPSRRIDYDNKGAPEQASSNCRDVLNSLMDLHSRLVREAAPLPPCTRLLVKQHGGMWMESSVARERAYLEDHAIHHCMLIAFALQEQQRSVPSAFDELCGKSHSMVVVSGR